MIRTTLAAAALVAMAVLPAAQAQDAKAPVPAKAPAAPAAAPAAGAAAASGKELYPKVYFDFLLKERLGQGQPDTPELRTSIREELNTRELLVREAKKKGLDKSAEVKNQMDLAAQTVLVSAFVADWVKKNPIPDAELRKEYDVIKAQICDKEYHVRHILVEKEDEAKDIIVQLQKGAKFDELAKARSKDPGSKDKGGDLDWNAPAGFVKPFSDAMVATPKGKFSTVPVQTQFGYHVIMVDEVREAKVPPFDEVKPQLQQRMQAAYLDKYFKELRAKNGV
jgi:peptidyl-prolyl cis-trans isomerase C